ncbi:MAG: hypothetical protein HYX94_06750 [Chloroflexi bacterium]|nr:hypothetical protein [Chloroflexota bacterium]
MEEKADNTPSQFVDQQADSSSPTCHSTIRRKWRKPTITVIRFARTHLGPSGPLTDGGTPSAGTS